MAPGADGSSDSTTAGARCPEQPCSCLYRLLRDCAAVRGYDERVPARRGHVQRDGTVTPAGEVAPPPPPRRGPRPRRPLAGALAPPAGAVRRSVQLRTRDHLRQGVRPPRVVRHVRRRRGRVQQRVLSEGDPADNGPYGKCKYDANRAGGKDDPKCYLEDKDYRCNDQEFTGITDADAGFDGAIDFVETADPAPAGATADLPSTWSRRPSTWSTWTSSRRRSRRPAVAAAVAAAVADAVAAAVGESVAAAVGRAVRVRGDDQPARH